MRLTNRYIEEKAIDIINQNIKTQRISSKIEKGSTEESWDGHLLFYENPSNKVDITKIPVQVKGTTKDFDNDKFSVNVDDLKNYRANGIVYFVVKIIFEDENPTSYKIYAKSLVGKEIDALLRSLRKNQKTKTITFNLISTANDFINLCNSYKIKQNAVSLADRFEISDKKITISDLKLVGHDDKVYSFPQVGKQYFLVYNEKNSSKYEPSIDISEVCTTTNKGIYINERKYFEKMEIRQGVDYKKYIFDGLIVELNIKDKRTNIQVQKCNNNQKLLNNLLFLKELLINKSFCVSDRKIDMGIIGFNQDDLSNLSFKISQLQVLIKFCDTVGIPQEMDFFNVKEDELMLINSILYNKEEKQITYHFVLTNEFKVAVIKLSGETYNLIFNVFDKKVLKYYNVQCFDNERNGYSFVPFYMLTIEQWSVVDIPDFTKIYSLIDTCLDFSNPIYDQTYRLITTLILAYDLKQNNKLLDIAQYLVNKLLSAKKGYALYHIADLEIKVRQGKKFNTSDRKLIDNLIELNLDVYKFIAYTLLNDKYNADKYLKNIDESWLKHPIYNLYNKLS